MTHDRIGNWLHSNTYSGRNAERRNHNAQEPCAERVRALYFDERGARISVEQFTARQSKPKSYAVTLGEFARHFAAVTEYMRSTSQTSPTVEV